MFKKTIGADLSGLVGFRQNTDATDKQLTGLLTSDSGLFVNDVHPLLTTKNLASIAEKDMSDAAFTTWLTQIEQGSILEAISEWANERVIMSQGSRVIDGGITPVVGLDESSPLSENFVGLEVHPGGKGRAITIHRIGLDFYDATISNLQIFIVRGGYEGFVWQTTTDFTSLNSPNWIDVNQVLDGNGPYYIVYDASNKNPKSQERLFKTKFSCRGVDTGQPSSVTTPWNLEENSYSLINNWGLYIDYSFGCDLTAFITANKNSFARLVQLKTAIRLLQELRWNASARVNRNEQNAANVRWDLEGDPSGRPTGIIAQYRRELKGLQLDMSGIDERCLGCKRGPKYGAV